ncbi:MAG: biotin synthetase [Bdellovibrionota bacterium]
MDHPFLDLKIGEITKIWAEQHELTVRYQAECDSTNNWAKSEAFSEIATAETLILYLCDTQTAGRGRGNNTWKNSRPGSALLSTWSFEVEYHPQPLTTLRLGLALIRSCQNIWPSLPWNLKAPNDLQLHEKKVAGILLESVSQGKDSRLLFGLGLNLFDAPKEIQTATSLVHSLPVGLPLLGEDYIGMLDRLLYEATDALSRGNEALSESEQFAITHFLNLNPNLTKKLTRVDAQGNLWTGDEKKPWMEI